MDEGLVYDKGIVSTVRARIIIAELVRQLPVADLPVTYLVLEDDTGNITHRLTFSLKAQMNEYS